MKNRLDERLVHLKLVSSRSQAESYIKLGKVTVNGQLVAKAGARVGEADRIKVNIEEQYVSRAALKLDSVAQALGLDFKDKTVLDVGSSTGGFTQYALKHGAAKVIAVEVGKNQLHPSLQGNPQIELHEQTDIRDFTTDQSIDLVVADVSFISLREILPAINRLTSQQSQIAVMVKPQFEAADGQKHKGVIKNDQMRRQILKDFEGWAAQKWLVIDKADSQVAGAKGNRERFYLLRKA